VLGIIMDRASDTLLAGLDHAIRRKVLGERAAKAFASLRIYILAKSAYLSADLDYLRSRLRIMRSSMINFCLLAIFGAVFILSRLPIAPPNKYSAAVTAFLLGVILASLSYYAWRASSITYYLRLQTAFALLPDDSSGDKEKNSASPPLRHRNGNAGGNGVSGR
jgi:hypothetical protein